MLIEHLDGFTGSQARNQHEEGKDTIFLGKLVYSFQYILQLDLLRYLMIDGCLRRFPFEFLAFDPFEKILMKIGVIFDVIESCKIGYCLENVLFLSGIWEIY